MLRRELSNNQLKEMLQFNQQSIPSGESNVSGRVGPGLSHALLTSSLSMIQRLIVMGAISQCTYVFKGMCGDSPLLQCVACQCRCLSTMAPCSCWTAAVMGCCLEHCSSAPRVKEDSWCAREWDAMHKELCFIRHAHSSSSLCNLCRSEAGAYVCTGNISGWTKCSFSTKTPDRALWKIPQELSDASDEL